ncbi:hypothetical protein Tco_1179306 [Tanacetum coccineum]
MKDKMEFNGDNVVGALMNIPIFVGTFSILTDFVVLEDMDAYRDEGMCDVIFGELFVREVRINARRFDGMIIIYNGMKKFTHPNGAITSEDLDAKKLTKLVKYQSFGILCVIVVMLEYKRIYNTHPCS